MWMQLQPIYCHLTYSLCKTWEIYLDIRIWITFNDAPTYFIGWHPSFLLVFKHTCIDSRRKVPVSHQCAHTEESTTASNIWSFNLPVSHSNLSAQYKTNHKYILVTYDETKVVAIMDQQYIAFQHANRTLLQSKCTLPTPHKPTIMYNIPICYIWPSNKATVFLVNIACTMSISICSSYLKPLDHFLKLWDTTISNNN